MARNLNLPGRSLSAGIYTRRDYSTRGGIMRQVIYRKPSWGEVLAAWIAKLLRKRDN